MDHADAPAAHAIANVPGWPRVRGFRAREGLPRARATRVSRGRVPGGDGDELADAVAGLGLVDCDRRDLGLLLGGVTAVDVDHSSSRRQRDARGARPVRRNRHRCRRRRETGRGRPRGGRRLRLLRRRGLQHGHDACAGVGRRLGRRRGVSRKKRERVEQAHSALPRDTRVSTSTRRGQNAAEICRAFALARREGTRAHQGPGPGAATHVTVPQHRWEHDGHGTCSAGAPGWASLDGADWGAAPSPAKKRERSAMRWGP